MNTISLYLAVPIDPGKRYLYVQFLGGKAFLEYLQELEVFPGRVTSVFTIHLNFMGQRYQSRPVACACEPAFEEGILGCFFTSYRNGIV